MKNTTLYIMIMLITWNNCEKVELSNITAVPLYLMPFKYFSNKINELNKSDFSVSKRIRETYPKLNETVNLKNETPLFEIKKVNEPKRNSVKLTMKQGLLMNQVLAVYALENVENESCKNHINEFRLGLRAFEPWALQMFDSSSKLQGGVLLGNLIDFGSFSQCLQIYKNTEFGPIYGKHCLLKIKPDIQIIKKILTFRNISEKRFVKVYRTVEKSELAWSVCVPHSCPRDDILRHFNKTFMAMAEGLDITVNLDEHYCNTVLNRPVMGRSQYIVLSFLLSFVFIGIIAAVLDLRSDEESNDIFIDTFSAYRNLHRIMKTGRAKKELHFINGFKIISSWCVVLGHRYIMYIMFPVINQLEELDWIIQLSSTMILGSTVSVDLFFMTSGMLVANGFFEYVTKTGNFNLILYYLHRYLRITLPLALVILFYVTLAQFLGSGPLLYDVYLNHQKSCEDYWWSALLHIQAYTNPSHLCIYPIWYLSNEMMFYFFSPVILYPLWKWPKFGYVNIVVQYVLAVAASFYRAWVDMYNGEVLPITNQLFDTKYFTNYYVPPHIRAAPYIIGLGFGYIVFQTRELRIKINKWLNIGLWCLSLAIMGLTVVSSRSFYLEDHEYNRLEATSYLAFHRSAWTLGVVWIMWSSMHGYGGIVHDLLSAQIFQVLGRITYAIFLIHTIVQLYKNGSAKAPMTFSNVNVIYDGFADYVAVLILSLLFTMFYELPLIRLEAHIFNKRSKKVNPKE